ncbi:MAG TPA: HDOD domain-containing protein [Candidatus Hydrogenedentes bacterium]|nr:HDOD domain-containing protein [Candidatus Hydrogenedentota bacterium]HIJ73847.1 HDOD domain-containing protein [Candidatus Hydrogenedentota bacterium]
MTTARPSKKKRIGELLIAEGLISEGQLSEGLALQAKQGGKIVELLISLGYLDSRTFLNFLASQEGMPSIDLSSYDMDPELVQLIPREIAVKHEIVPLDKLGRLLTVGMTCPLDSGTIRMIEETTGLRVKALLCSPNDLTSMINRYYPPETKAKPEPETKAAVGQQIQELQSPLKLKSAVSLLRQIETLPALPRTIQRVRELVHDPESSIDDVADVIAADPAIAAKTLSVANSAAYGFPNRIESLKLAVTLLGVREVYSIVLSTSVVGQFDKAKNFDYRTFWLDSTYCATAAKAVAEACGKKRKEGVFSAGLLHDIGRVALLQVVPERYGSIPSGLSDAALIAAEEEEFGIAHTEAGYELASQWGLPADIAEAIRFHHRPEMAIQAEVMVAIVAVASTMARVHGLAFDEQNRALSERASSLAVLGMRVDTAVGVLQDLPPPQECSVL